MKRCLILLAFALAPLLAQAAPDQDAANLADLMYQAPAATTPVDIGTPSATMDTPAAAQPAVAAKTEGTKGEPLASKKIANEFWYVLMLGFMCLASLAIILHYLHRREGSPKDMVNSAGLTLIIFGTIILVLVVSTSEQLTAAIGVLGAIAGYLFRSAQEGGGKPTVAAESRPTTP